MYTRPKLYPLHVSTSLYCIKPADHWTHPSEYHRTGFPLSHSSQPDSHSELHKAHAYATRVQRLSWVWIFLLNGSVSCCSSGPCVCASPSPHKPSQPPPQTIRVAAAVWRRGVCVCILLRVDCADRYRRCCVLLLHQNNHTERGTHATHNKSEMPAR